LVNFRLEVGPVGIEPTTHRLKVRHSKTTLCQSNPIYPEVAIRPNLFGMGLTQPRFIYPVRKLFGNCSEILVANCYKNCYKLLQKLSILFTKRLVSSLQFMNTLSFGFVNNVSMSLIKSKTCSRTLGS